MRYMIACLVACSALNGAPAYSQMLAPPVVSGPNDPEAFSRTVLSVPEASVSCDDGRIAPTASDAFAPSVQTATFTSLPVGQATQTASYDFSISSTGLPLGIRPVSSDGFSRLAGPVDAETQAALSSWTFPAEARPECRLILRYTPISLARADIDVLVRFYALSRPGGPLREAVERRLRRPGDDCDRPPALRTLAYPDFLRADRPRPGSRAWAAVRWDVGADGSTAAVETIGSSGDAILDAEVRRAIAETTYRTGPRKGCLYNYWRNGPPLEAPPVNRTAPDDPLAQCPETVTSRFSPGAMTYPAAFLARSVEGWALVRFDIATWGQIGNVAVVEAQPAAAFGEAAARIVATGRATPSFAAATRCVVPVIFRLPDAAEPEMARLPGTSPGPTTPPALSGPLSAPF